MPELPEVEGVVKSLQPIITGRKIVAVTTSDILKKSHDDGKEAIVKAMHPNLLAELLVGMTIARIERRSKYIYFYLHTEGEQYILVNHLGMSGAWFHVAALEQIPEAKFRKHAHVFLQLDDHHFLIYSDIRRFGELRLLKKIADYPPLLQLAPEPFEEEAKAFFLGVCQQPKYAKKAIKEVIMDSHAICGAGNIYATEALFAMKIHPGRKVSNLTEEQLAQLFDKIVDVLDESIAFGGSSISDYRNINGESGSMQNRLKMYGMKKCPMCHTNSQQILIANRNSYFCPNCQK
ncbi:bifunctional DNA-formamidopyrimidine glycosylase/DNA-(apurinic or apyrimidinic site) lyase [Kurthia sibirica]|uniref:DNA-formamidopyrimidine glycosylase n=1 Tax=Kurthia sibirica TaxID=202750 RepID=A0A2U3AP09_9BACL|nr:bifunctional DNA-formamidopyrimidine glycosylase/DNA-(apurinic or apyrimidinic site) lyase [Kurthia sibirica]PWI26185.1 DNA-formamidopyrimidine glycosylase [Kurthia sibirica]GEK35375.1 formamidopyrimidine-DNA glycosylase [Kurthia sibirica]